MQQLIIGLLLGGVIIWVAKPKQECPAVSRQPMGTLPNPLTLTEANPQMAAYPEPMMGHIDPAALPDAPRFYGGLI